MSDTKPQKKSHIILIDHGLKCTLCGISDTFIPNDLDIVIIRIELFKSQHSACLNEELKG